LDRFKHNLIPIVLAFAITNVVILISHSFNGINRFIFQVFSFTTAVSFSIAYIISNHSSELDSFLDAFSNLSSEIRFVISMIVIVAVYFGGGMYYSTPDDLVDSLDKRKANKVVTITPASSDNLTTFKIPENLPTDPKLLFEFMFEK
jgi:hypothetical protein